jgi:DNA-binding XRE family transcriptional regulator
VAGRSLPLQQAAIAVELSNGVNVSDEIISVWEWPHKLDLHVVNGLLISMRSSCAIRGIDLTQEEFAARIGVSQNYLSTMEHGKIQIGAEILLNFAREFGRSIEWLLAGGS